MPKRTASIPEVPRHAELLTDTQEPTTPQGHKNNSLRIPPPLRASAFKTQSKKPNEPSETFPLQVTASIRRHLCALCVLCGLIPTLAHAQTQPAPPEEIKIAQPLIDKAAQKITLPGNFWNSKTAPWVETALSGHPSDFLHETILCASTTRTLLEQALRDIGCHDGDAWVDSVADFPKIRGDRFLVILEFTLNGKKQTWSLDELLTLQTADVSWNSALGPYGFIFRGDPDHSPKPAPPPNEPPLEDSAKILRDDPQIALTFKGLQAMSQSFADHPLAYCDDWVYDTLNRGRNYSALPPAVFNANTTIPVTLTFQKVTEEELLNQSTKLWHDATFIPTLRKQVPLAKQIDKDKTEYWNIRQDLAKIKSQPAELRDAQKIKTLTGRSALLMSQIAKNYAAIDAAWTIWMIDHAQYPAEDAKAQEAFKRQSALWREHMLLLTEKADLLASAEESAADQRDLEAAGGSERILGLLRGKEIFARSGALLADNKQDRDYWLEQADRLDPVTDPRDAWIKDVRLDVALTGSREHAASAGIAYGSALTSALTADAELTRLQHAYALATARVSFFEACIQLANVEFEISKREGLAGPGAPEDPDLPPLRKRRDSLLQDLKKETFSLISPEALRISSSY